VPGKLKELHADGYMIAIVSNQAGISLKPDSKLPAGHKKRYADFKVKSTSIFNQLEIPVSLYAATEHDIYRKPRPGMWQVLLEDHNLAPDMIDMEQSVFVGDAAGRTADGTSKADFSCGDRNLADNLGLPFRTPEEFFLGEQPRAFVRSFEPSRYVPPIPTQSNALTPVLFSKKHDLDIVILVGSPGSGKSTFFQQHLAPLGYNRVNQDTLKKREKCVEVAQEHLKHKESVVVDNTNRDIVTRKVWVDLAKAFDVPIRCIYFTAESALCEHNNVVRALNETHNPEKRILLPSSVFPMYRKAFQPPELVEGFEDITQVEFALEGTEEQRIAWAKYWV
jgi:bifunctional polynucleotide phosphatase/kinase